MSDVIIIPEENRCLVVAEEDRTIEVPAEVRIIEVTDMLLASKQHTAGDTRQWTLKYEKWLANTATIEQISILSSLPSYNVGTTQVLGTDVVFLLSGGNVNDQTTLTLAMTDSLGNVKTDTVLFTAVAP